MDSEYAAKAIPMMKVRFGFLCTVSLSGNQLRSGKNFSAESGYVSGTGQIYALATRERNHFVLWLNLTETSEAELRMRTLTNLYNQRPAWLAHVHVQLDAAVFVAYGWPGSLGKQEVLARLLALNHARGDGSRSFVALTTPASMDRSLRTRRSLWISPRGMGVRSGGKQVLRRLRSSG